MPTDTLQENAIKLSIADAVWIASALLQKEHPDSIFSTDQIVQRVKAEHLSSSADHVIAQHVRQHCVANRLPQPNRLRMLTAHGRGDRSLFREGDSCSPGREEGRTRPNTEDIPE